MTNIELQLHDDKTEAILISTPQKLAQLPSSLSIQLGSTNVPMSSSAIFRLVVWLRVLAGVWIWVIGERVRFGLILSRFSAIQISSLLLLSSGSLVSNLQSSVPLALGPQYLAHVPGTGSLSQFVRNPLSHHLRLLLWLNCFPLFDVVSPCRTVACACLFGCVWLVSGCASDWSYQD